MRRARRHPFLATLVALSAVNLIGSTLQFRAWGPWPFWRLISSWLAWTGLLLGISLLFMGTLWLLWRWVQAVDKLGRGDPSAALDDRRLPGSAARARRRPPPEGG